MHTCSIWLPKIVLCEWKLALRNNKVVCLICDYGYCLYHKSNPGNQAVSIYKRVLVVLFEHTCHWSVVEKQLFSCLFLHMQSLCFTAGFYDCTSKIICRFRQVYFSFQLIEMIVLHLELTSVLVCHRN